MRDNATPHDDVLISEYRTISESMNSGAVRAWQAMSVLVAIYFGGAVILKDVVPDRQFPEWLRLAAIWTVAIAGLVASGFWWSVMTREAFLQWLGHLRMVDIELELGMRRETYQFLLTEWRERDAHSGIGAAWRNAFQRLDESERKTLIERHQSNLYGPIPSGRLLRAGQTIGATSAIAITVASVAASIFLLTQ